MGELFGEKVQVEATEESLQAIAAQSDADRLAGARALIAAARTRVAEAIESGEVSEADFADPESDRRK